ncbi:helix-turn-helix domain-containing protein [Falsibacillus pallidus]|uniref:XRE family transcriptional regulator of biofilm formation n=1 Tax=Falsibacillus pallidus TaxID=493781 RepID=A0A370GPR5_9BACI|nr:helix-turn-helix transcriptional regulator [Falsibacillus pallidus]RDI45715.1 XRE family transcriptional regulator of biofilm formation [Falsibacillus pallidus]
MLGQKIYELRKRKGLTLSELADRADISKSYLSNIERNINKNPSIQVTKKIAAVLDVDLNVLLNADSKKINETIETEIADLAKELKSSGIEREQIEEYRTLLEFIKWKNQNSDVK